MYNPFSKKTTDFEKAEKEVKEELQQLQVIANDLLNDQRYKKFAKILDDAKKNTIELFLAYKENDPYKYKAKVDEYLTELRVYGNILRSANELANPVIKNKPNLTQEFKGRMGEILEKL